MVFNPSHKWYYNTGYKKEEIRGGVSKMKEVGIAVVGLGIIGERLIGTFLKHPNCKIIGGFDLDENRSKYNLDHYFVTVASFLYTSK